MKQHKSEENIGLSAKKPSKISQGFSMLKNNKGLTITELLVTSMIGIIISMAISSIFVMAIQQFTILVEKNEAEQNILQTTYYLRKYLSQAVDVDAVGNVSGAFPGGTGQIDVNFNLLSGAETGGANTGGIGRLAIFRREAGRVDPTGAMPTGGSELRPTGIFVRDTRGSGEPNIRSGAVVFDVTAAQDSMGPLMPDTSDLFFTRLHNLRVVPAECEMVNAAGVVQVCGGGGGKIKTITIEVIFRYFTTSNKDLWNYRAPVGGGVVTSYRDITQAVKINFRNNVLTTNSYTSAPGSEERVHGGLYFYDYALPLTRF